MKLRIIAGPDPRLQKVCELVTDFNRDIFELAMNMQETMRLSNGIGLAAPQVGELARVVCVMGNVLINPEVIDACVKETGWNEECLSFQGKSVWVVRPKWVKVAYHNVHGSRLVKTFRTLEARVVQHEMDHLEGKCIL